MKKEIHKAKLMGISELLVASMSSSLAANKKTSRANGRKKQKK